jgi:NAD(P)-dependent dehydrogenase (short-subunit alcohol dehydrogenase family)
MTHVDRLPAEIRSPEPGRVALVTGGNSGIGLAVARQLLDRDVTVWIGSRDVEKGQRAARDLGSGVRVVQLDVTDTSSVAAAVNQVGELDILVNSAGVNPGGEDVAGTTVDQLRTAYETNVFGLVAVTQGFLPALARSAHPRVVNVSSGTGSLTWSSGPNPQFDWQRAQGGGVAYRSSKTAGQRCHPADGTGPGRAHQGQRAGTRASPHEPHRRHVCRRRPRRGCYRSGPAGTAA